MVFAARVDRGAREVRIATVAPALAKTVATCSPIPEAAPVTTAVLPASEKGIGAMWSARPRDARGPSRGVNVNRGVHAPTRSARLRSAPNASLVHTR